MNAAYLDDVNNDDFSGLGLETMLVVGGDIVKNWFVIVTMWDKKSYGRVKREYLKEFDEAERAKIAEIYKRCYSWYLRTGIPHNGVRMKHKTYKLASRAANFFGSI